jgi:hypothetical protein
MTNPVLVDFDSARAVLESVAQRLKNDEALNRSGISLSMAEGAQGTHIERVSLTGANGTFELVAKDDGIYLGSLKEWPLHAGDEQHADKAVDYLTAMMRAEATGTAFHRVSVKQFGA